MSIDVTSNNHIYFVHSATTLIQALDITLYEAIEIQLAQASNLSDRLKKQPTSVETSLLKKSIKNLTDSIAYAKPLKEENEDDLVYLVEGESPVTLKQLVIPYSWKTASDKPKPNEAGWNSFKNLTSELEKTLSVIQSSSSLKKAE